MNSSENGKKVQQDSKRWHLSFNVNNCVALKAKTILYTFNGVNLQNVSSQKDPWYQKI